VHRIAGALFLAGVVCVSAAGAAQNVRAAHAAAIKTIADTSNGIHAFQSFDYHITPSEARAHANRYAYLWSASTYPVPRPWYQGNPAIVATHYIPYARDSSYHTLKWFEHFHPDWILYRCDRKTPAWEYGDTTTVPIDFTDADAVAYQLKEAVYYAGAYDKAGTVNGIAADNLSLGNLWGGCGAFRNGRWVQVFTGASADPGWRDATIRWVANASAVLHAQSPPLRLDGNFSPVFSPFGDAAAASVVENLDGLFDEAGFTNYGSGLFSGSQWLNAEKWMAYAQSRGKTWLSVNGFSPAGASVVDFAVASYLMGKGHAAAIFISTTGKGGVVYGSEEWQSIYDAPIGTACAAMYYDQGAYFRAFSGGLAVVNANATKTLQLLLPKHAYTTVAGVPAGAMLRLGPTSGAVLLTANGCSASGRLRQLSPVLQ